jgi:hypothetical protein
LALDLMEKDLVRQSLVWLEGLHLPWQIELRRGIKGVSLVE